MQNRQKVSAEVNTLIRLPHSAPHDRKQNSYSVIREQEKIAS